MRGLSGTAFMRSCSELGAACRVHRVAAATECGQPFACDGVPGTDIRIHAALLRLGPLDLHSIAQSCYLGRRIVTTQHPIPEVSPMQVCQSTRLLSQVPAILCALFMSTSVFTAVFLSGLVVLICRLLSWGYACLSTV